MRTKRINGTQIEQMLRNGLANIYNQEDIINNANVFPVPDGDTGTNMVLTLANGITKSKSNVHIGLYLKDVTSNMLLGARGNSGVILSQIFKGFSKELENDSIADVGELTNAFIRAYKTAYKAVERPVEGTILTVSREGIEGIKTQIGRGVFVENLFSMYLAELRKSLAYTPEVLPVLKEAGVVDSGAMGYISIIEGMVKSLYGENIVSTRENKELTSLNNLNILSEDYFNDKSIFEYGYCMEFLLQRLKNQKYNQRFRIDSFINDLKLYGDSIVCIEEKTRVKVHIHTKVPAKVITLAQDFGEFISFKLENMQLQHNEFSSKTEETNPEKEFAIVAVVSGEGIKDIYQGLGCTYIIDGGQTMNTSVQEFVEAYKIVNAKKIVVFPNNKNSINVAKQASELYGKSDVEVIETESIIEGYYAIAMDVGDSVDYDYRIRMMKSGIEGVNYLSIFKIIKNCSYNGLECKKDEYLALHNGEPSVTAPDFLTCILAGLKTIENIEDKESAIIFTSGDVDSDLEEEIVNTLTSVYPNLQVDIITGGQAIYELMIGII